MFERYGIAKAHDVCNVLHSVDLQIEAEQNQFSTDVQMVQGRFVWKIQKMQVARSMNALAHEILHSWEFNRTLLNMWELGESPGTWDDNSDYTEMIAAYERGAKSLDKELWSIQW